MSYISCAPVDTSVLLRRHSCYRDNWFHRLGLFFLAVLVFVGLGGNAHALTATNATLTASATSVNVGANVVLTASVAPTSATGTVTFKDGSTSIGAGTLSAGKATLSANFASVGTHKITATYGGSPTYAGSASSVVNVTANAISTTTAVTASSTALTPGQSATLTATVTPSAATGSVTFKDGSTALGTSALSAGKATLSLPTGFSATGTHNITAAYGGTSTYTQSTSAALKITVSALTATTTTLTVPGTAIGVGQAVSLSAKVSPTAATGTVTFKDGTTVLGTGTLSAGVAALNVSGGFSTAGTHSLVASYDGSAAYAASTSPVVTKTVTGATTTSALTAVPATATINQAVALKVAISPIAATGNVTFKDGGTSIGTATVNAGLATMSHAFTSAGLHVITATYAGDSTYAGSATQDLNYSVTGAPGTIPAPPVPPQPSMGYLYDAQGNLARETRAPDIPGFGFTTSIAVDGLDRPSIITNAAGGKIQFTHDETDRRDDVRDPRGLTTTYYRDGLGQTTQILSPDTMWTNLAYDAAGNISRAVNSREVEAAHSYDALNRRISITYSKYDVPTQVLGWTYDQTGGIFTNGIGRLTTSTFPEGSHNFAYDPQGRVALMRQTINAATSANSAAVVQEIRYTYDASGQLIGLTYPSGRKLTIQYVNGRPTRLGIAKDSLSAENSILTDIQFAPWGEPKSWYWVGNGMQVHERQFDTAGRMIRYPLGPVLRDVSYDAANRITAYKHYALSSGAVAPAYDQQFAYDALDRLTQATTAQATWTYTYDANGNRTGAAVNNGTPSVYENSASSNQLISVSVPNVQLNWDPTGNITSDGNFTLTYDLRGRLANIRRGGVSTTYAYDTRGQRVRKSGGTTATTTIFAYDLKGNLLGEYDGQGKAIREYVWLGAVPVAVFTPDPAQAANASTATPLVFYVHADHINTPRMVVDQNGSVRWSWMAEPFGTTPADESPSGLSRFTLNLRFPGQYYDAESGIHQNWHRDYIPGIGRYAQSDPLGLLGGINTFAYVDGNPLNKTDPLGLWTFQFGFTVTGSAVPGAFGLGAYGQAAVGLAIDGNGNVGGYWTLGGGGAFGTPGIVAGVQGAWSNGSTICDLSGDATNLGLNAAGGWGGTIDTFGGSGTQGQPVGGLGVTIGGGAGVAGYGGVSRTGVTLFGKSQDCSCRAK